MKTLIEPSARSRCGRPSGSGFTLIEFVGVLALTAILAALILPNVIRQVDHAAWTRETSDLNTIAEAFERSIVRTKTIPTANTMAAAVAQELAMSANAITATPRGRPRAFLFDPNMRINGVAPAGLPFTQTAAGSVPPVSARVILVSSLTQPLPVTTGVPSSAVFDSIWAAGENAVPASWGTYNGTGEELRIRRINLGPLFHRLMLIDRDSDTVDPSYQPPLFSIDSPATFEVASGAAGHDALYLDGTVVGLHSAGGALHTRYVQKRDISFVFERGLWRGWIGPGNPTFDASDEFVAEAVAFLGSDWNANARRGASQTGVLVTMYVFMFDYALWAEECPNFSTHGAPGGANVQNVPEYAVLDSLGKNQAGGILYGASLDLLDR